MDAVQSYSSPYSMSGLQSSRTVDSHEKKSSWDTVDMHNYQSPWTTETRYGISSWDEAKAEKTKDSTPSTTQDHYKLAKIQLIGVVLVLLLILAIAGSLAVVISGISNNSTITSRMANLFELELLTCGNMTLFENTIFSGNDLVSLFQTTYSKCCTSCLTTERCIGFTWNTTGNICYQKSSISPMNQYDMDFISAKY